MYKVLVSDKLGQAGIDILTEASDIDLTIETGLDEAGLINIIGDFEALIIRSGTKATSELLQAAKKLRVVGRAGVGVDNVDIEAATRKGVIVMNTPAANTIATAELAMALILASARNIVPSHNSTANGEWRRSEFAGTELRGKVLGIAGFGRVGRAVAERAKAFDMKVHVYDPYISESVGRELGVEIMDLIEVLATCDYLSLHSVLNDETRYLINSERLAMMKKGSVLINVARGGLIDEKAVAESLENGNLKIAAIDVFSSEPPTPDNPLLNNPNVIHTPHLGASTAEAQRDVAIDVANQVLDALRGDKITNCVNLDFSSSIGFDRVAPYIELSEKMGLLQAAMADGPITSVEIEVISDESEDLVKPVAAGLLKGLMTESHEGRLNYVNAPMLGQENGLEITRSQGIGDGRSNSATCKVKWDGGERIVSGKVYDGSVQRIVRISGYRFEAAPEGTVLLMLNDDVPGVVGAVGSKLGELGINIAEWRLGRDLERNEALSYINLDNSPTGSDLEQISELEKVRKAVVIEMSKGAT